VEPLTFEFVEDDQLRISLEADQRELFGCVERSAIKAAHVLAGSIVEALLLDALLALDQDLTRRAALLRMEFGEIIRLAQECAIISSRTADLCSVVKSYRNLVHPSRAVRMGDSIDGSSARIAQDLVSVIAAEVSAKRRAVSGPSAAQVVRKLKSDPHALAIARNLVSALGTRQTRKFILEEAPGAYLEIKREAQGLYSPDGMAPVQDLRDPNGLQRQARRLAVAWKQAFDASHAGLKEEWTKGFVDQVKRGELFEIETLGDGLFESRYLAHVSEADRDLLIAHVISRLAQDLSFHSFAMASGIGPYLKPESAREWIDALVRPSSVSVKGLYSEEITSLVVTEHTSVSPEVKEAIESRMELWKAYHERRNSKNGAWISNIHRLLTESDADIPF
jgi:hypothetical protein